MKKAVLAVSEHIKHEPFKRYVIDMVSIGYTYDMVPSVTDTVTDTGTDTVTVSETETENRDSACAPSQSPEKQKRFKAPTIEEITAYCQEIGSKVNPQRFFDYYTSNGWKVGRNPMKDWKATIRRWSDDEKPSQGTKNSSIDLSEAEKLFNSF